MVHSAGKRGIRSATEPLAETYQDKLNGMDEATVHDRVSLVNAWWRKFEKGVGDCVSSKMMLHSWWSAVVAVRFQASCLGFDLGKTLKITHSLEIKSCSLCTNREKMEKMNLVFCVVSLRAVHAHMEAVCLFISFWFHIWFQSFLYWTDTFWPWLSQVLVFLILRFQMLASWVHMLVCSLVL